MIILAGSFRIGAGMRAAAQAALATMVAASRAELGCRAYTFAFDVTDEHLVQVFEIYDSADALAAHRASAHMAAWRAQAADLGVTDRALTHFDVQDWRPV